MYVCLHVYTLLPIKQLLLFFRTKVVIVPGYLVVPQSIPKLFPRGYANSQRKRYIVAFLSISRKKVIIREPLSDSIQRGCLIQCPSVSLSFALGIALL